ncbi:HEPN domain-containing protein [Candidatus Pacearchaeota archaeon]|nr:HEPN domain-containing protein [Candidatus Pacearchaeota archaeon]
MREEISNWLRQSEEDLDKARILFENKKFDGVAFNCHQSVEKSLKALYMLKFNQGEKGHSIIHLASKLSVPQEMLSRVRDLNPEYLVSRYPDIAGGVPADNYDEEIAMRHFKVAKEVLEWVKKQMQK